ncbi:MAG: hypothetical protein KKB25_00675 [Nanoarchaeota archaeon]|nr:hypothetical protein [Nanoarchaeota archaeon]
MHKNKVFGMHRTEGSGAAEKSYFSCVPKSSAFRASKIKIRYDGFVVLCF